MTIQTFIGQTQHNTEVEVTTLINYTLYKVINKHRKNKYFYYVNLCSGEQLEVDEKIFDELKQALIDR